MTPPPDFPDPLRESFEPIRPLGTGAFAHVFLARDRALGREVAVKVLRSGGEGESGKRFVREASTLAALRSPHVVEVYDYGVVGDIAYLAMEYLEGESLAVHQEAVDVRSVMAGVGRGLLAVHEAGLVHRDLKPENVLLARDGRVVLADFGLVSSRKGGTRITRAGARIGTVLYMAPEVLRGQPATPGADWYAWGVMLYRLLLGRTPHEIDEVLGAIRGEPLHEATLEGVTPGSPEIGFLRRTLSLDPGARALTAAELDLFEVADLRTLATLPVTRPSETFCRDLEPLALDPKTTQATPRLETDETPAPRGRSKAPLVALLLLGAGVLLAPEGLAPGGARPGEPPAGAEDLAAVERLVDSMLARVMSGPAPPVPSPWGAPPTRSTWWRWCGTSRIPATRSGGGACSRRWTSGARAGNRSRSRPRWWTACTTASCT
jgi:serine/threonine-protein kinase